MDPMTPTQPSNEEPMNSESKPSSASDVSIETNSTDAMNTSTTSNDSVPSAPVVTRTSTFTPSSTADIRPAQPAESSLPPAPAVISPTLDASATPFVSSAEAASASPTEGSFTPTVSDATWASSTAQPMVNGVAGTATTDGSKQPRSAGKPRWLLPAVVLAVLIVLGGGYVFGYYLPNQPSAIFSKSLQNSGSAVDKLIGFSKTNTAFSTVTLNSTVNIKSAGVSGDVTLTGALDKTGNGTLSVNADIVGEQIKAEVRSIKKPANDSPDLYFQVSGVKSALDAQGLTAYDNLDGQWISVDHTLIDTYKSALEAQTGTDGTQVPTTAEINDAVTRIQTVNKQYLFSTDANTAVLVNQKFIGKESMDGVSVDHFQTGYNKDHLSSYVTAIKTAVDASSLPSSYKKMYDSAFTSAADSAKKSDGKYSFDLYADTSSKLVHAVTFGDTADKTSKVTFSQNYKGGTDYPFAIDLESKANSQNESVKIGYSFNSVTNKVHSTINAVVNSTTVTGSFDATASNTPVAVTAPASSKTINSVLSQLGLGNLSNPSTTSASTAADSSLFTLTQ